MDRNRYFTTSPHLEGEPTPLPDPISDDLAVNIAHLIMDIDSDMDIDNPEELGFESESEFKYVRRFINDDVAIAVVANNAVELFIAAHLKEFFGFATSLRSAKT